MTCKFYVDESGHTGIDHLKADQPVFVMAGWIVPPSLQGGLEEIVGRWSLKDQDEPKFGKAIKKGRGQKRAAGLITEALDLGCVAVVDAWDKRFAIATRMVDSFCDWDHNFVARRAVPVDDHATRRGLAEFIVTRFPEDALAEFARAFQDADPVALEEAKGRAVRLFDLAGSPLLGPIFDACDVGSLVEDIQGDDCKRMPEYPSFVNLLHAADGRLVELGLDGEVVYDNLNDLMEPFRDVFSLLSSTGRRVPIWASGAQVGVMGIVRLKSFKMEDSPLTPGIQAADALAAAFRYAMVNPACVELGQALHDPIKRILGLGMGAPQASALGKTVTISLGPARIKSFFSPFYAIGRGKPHPR